MAGSTTQDLGHALALVEPALDVVSSRPRVLLEAISTTSSGAPFTFASVKDRGRALVRHVEQVRLHHVEQREDDIERSEEDLADWMVFEPRPHEEIQIP